MKNRLGFQLLLSLFVCIMLPSCSSNSEAAVSNNPFDTIRVSSNSLREKIVVISDLHLGNDLSYSENVAHMARLEEFLKEVRSSATVKELILGGDIFDEWYIPTRTNTYGGGSLADFIRKSVESNKAIFAQLRGIINDGKIKLTYIPGNHDMGFTAENVNIALPGVNQARDDGDKYGVGRYYPEGYPQIVVEHGHRYDFFSCLTPGANEADAPGAILPPGYFFARIAANSFTNPTTSEAATKVPVVTLKDKSNAEQYTKFVYYNLWQKVMSKVIYVKDNFADPIIVTNVGHYTKTYSINDILPYNATDGSIQMNLYNGLFTQTAWNERQKYNNVSVMTNINEALVGSLETQFIDRQSDVQYFKDSLSTVRIVVFGHTHEAMLVPYNNAHGQSCIYANSGTWEDLKARDKNAAIDQDAQKMHFVVISPEKSNNKRLNVGLYQYLHGKHELISNKGIDL